MPPREASNVGGDWPASVECPWEGGGRWRQVERRKGEKGIKIHFKRQSQISSERSGLRGLSVQTKGFRHLPNPEREYSEEAAAGAWAEMGLGGAGEGDGGAGGRQAGKQSPTGRERSSCMGEEDQDETVLKF